MDPAMPSPLSVDTSGDKSGLPVKGRFEDALKSFLGAQALKRKREKIDETLSEPEEEMEIGATPNEEVVPGNFSPGTTRQLLQSLSGDNWVNTTTPPLASSR